VGSTILNAERQLGGSMKFQIGKSYKTRAGQKATLTHHYPDALPNRRLVGEIFPELDLYFPAWYEDGRFLGDVVHEMDLIAEWDTKEDAAKLDAATFETIKAGLLTLHKVREQVDQLNFIDGSGKPLDRYVADLFPAAAWDRLASISLKSPPAFEPFTLGNGHEVSFKDGRLGVGCQQFSGPIIKQLLQRLESLSHGDIGGVEAFSPDIQPTRIGVIVFLGGESHEYTWLDVDKMIAALSKLP
jgi:hypothetical protein